ncbi:MAG: Gfo/Idh/MocA family oxidoreductase [Candidatus Limnocylindria bacterium]
MPERVALGVVGYGWFAELLHERVLKRLPRLEVTALCELDEVRRRRGTEHLEVPGYATAEAMLDAEVCDAVAIFTPHSTHRELVELSASRGRHVFCEKAMAVTSEDCVAMISASQVAGVELMVGHMQKLFPPYARLAELVRGGTYGAPVAVQVSGFHWSPVFEGWWRRRRDCGGLLYWTGIHDIDTLRHVLASEVDTVFAMTGPTTDDYTDYEDAIAVVMRHTNGAIASLQVAQHDPLKRFEEAFSMSVVCEHGGVAFDPKRNVVVHAARDGLSAQGTVVEAFAPHEDSMFVAYAAEFRHFVEVVLDKVPSRLSGEDGLRCVETLEAITTSAQRDRPVTVSRALMEVAR